MSRIEAFSSPGVTPQASTTHSSDADWLQTLSNSSENAPSGDLPAQTQPAATTPAKADAGSPAKQAAGQPPGNVQINERRPPIDLSMVGGAGLIGQQHIERIEKSPEASVHSVIGASQNSRNFAEAKGVPWFASIQSMVQASRTNGEISRPAGAIVCSPNANHLENGLALIGAKIPTLMEKPLADTTQGAQQLVDAADAAGVTLLTGHHRRHNDTVREAKSIIDSGRLGTITTAHGSFCLFKPDKYFEGALRWHAEPGAGPVLLNLVHDIDLMRHLVGDVESVFALQSNAIRGFPVDETTAAVIKFKNGALGTFNVSDTVVAPHSWEHTAGENLVYPKTDNNCYSISGTKGTLEIPTLKLWTQNEPDWQKPFRVEAFVGPRSDALANQIAQFCAVIRGEQSPLVSGREGLETLKVIDAILESARQGMPVNLT